MASITANGIRIEYESHGDPAHPAILLIMGLGMQLVTWPDELVDRLVARGFRVVRFDNRDAGLSQQFDGQLLGPLAMSFMRWQLGWQVFAPYTLDDMAADAIGLLDALQIERAHVVGVSMGGMIAQLLAIKWRERVRSLTSIMSTTSARRLPQPRMDAFVAMVSRPPSIGGIEPIVDHYVHLFRVIGSPGHPTPEPVLRANLRRSVARAFRPSGNARQIVAILAAPDRSRWLPTITAPTLVIHGDADPLVPPAHGEDTASKIPGASLEVIAGMGHDLPPSLMPRIADLIASHCAAADRA